MEGQDQGNRELLGIFKGPDNLVGVLPKSVVFSSVLLSLSSGEVKILD